MAKSYDDIQSWREVEIAGYPCLVRRPAVMSWALTGMIPQELADQLVRLTETQETDEPPSEADKAEAAELGKKLFRYEIELCLKTPDGRGFSFDPEPGKVCIFDLDNPDAFILEARNAIHSLPIKTVEGEVSAGALTPFRGDEGRTHEPTGARAHGTEVRPKAKRNAGTA